MKLASGDFGVWLIIAIIAIVGKLWNTFVTPTSEDETEPAPPPVRPARPPVQKSLPPVMRPVTKEMWQAPPDKLREFMKRVTHPPQSPPLAVEVPAAKPTPPPAPVKPAPVQPARTESKWVQALRDRQNLRNIIISAEIIGPPRGV